jgi:hypothetical protein
MTGGEFEGIRGTPYLIILLMPSETRDAAQINQGKLAGVLTFISL